MKHKKSLSLLLTAAMLVGALPADGFSSKADVVFYVYGDANGDGTLSGLDLSCMKRMLLTNTALLTSQKKQMDLDGDGTVGLSDVSLLQDFLLRKVDTFPVGGYFTENVPVIQRYYAVDAAYNQAFPETTNAGFDGDAYINYENLYGGYVNWTVDAPVAGNYKLTFRYANGTDTARTCRLTCNDVSAYYDQGFAGTGAWTTWDAVSVVLSLQAGQNTIKALAITSDGGPNMDYLDVEPTTESAVMMKEPTIPIIPTNGTIVEKLDRGVTAINTGSGMLVSWRVLANDAEDTTFRLYRNDRLLYTSKAGGSTCYLDQDGTTDSAYEVEVLHNGTVTETETCSHTSENAFLEVKLQVPPASGDCTYSANDCSVGDVDGDGEYELFVKWDPSNAKDNSQDGYTGNVYIDCYKLDNTRLWRIDLGKNIRAGAHYTQFLVADFDCDGKAEMTCKTADETVDGTGKMIGSASDNRNASGYILTGNEFYTLFDGMTGAALDTVNYNPGRGTVSDWGDKYGNRVDRFLGAVAYLDGKKPSAITVRGYYTRMTACAYDVVDKKLVERWYFDSNKSGMQAAAGNGNHNCMPADVDGDGFQELVLGSTCIDHDGSLKWCNDLGHGDAMHLSDLLPDRPGLELWYCHEVAPYGSTLCDAATGEIVMRYTAGKDTGRACAANIWADNPGAEFWGSAAAGLYNGSGQVVASNANVPVNGLVYWDGDLERELADGYAISKFNGNGVTRLLTGTGCASNNGTKSTACLSADILGDWREEYLLRTEDSSAIRIYCTPYTTPYRLTTLMHDPQYRMQVAGENIAYNQPAHPSFYLGSDAALLAKPNVVPLQ